MRLFFSKGGRTGCLTCEALADYMETLPYTYPDEDDRDVFGTHLVGEMFIDFSPDENGKGELFRSDDKFLCDMFDACKIDDFGVLNREGVRNLAASYWAEAEAIELARAAPKKRQRAKRANKSQRL